MLRIPRPGAPPDAGERERSHSRRRRTRAGRREPGARARPWRLL